MLHTQDQDDARTAVRAGGGNLTATVEEGAAGQHEYKTVWNQKVAGFTLHSFSDDYASLTTDYVDYQGNTVHSFTVKKSSRQARARAEPGQ